MQSQLPNLIVIGTMKCGTTSLHAYLDKHPDIFMSEIKEIDFFVAPKNYNKGLDWYKEQFRTDKPIRGESSQNYSKCHTPLYKGVAKRIHKAIPQVKLIYIVRDPIKRIQSHYVQNIAHDNEKLEFYDFIGYPDNMPNNTFVLTGNYYIQLKEYLKYFPMSSIHVTCLEELNKDTLVTLNKIFDFLGVERIHNKETFNFIENKGVDKTVQNRFGAYLQNSSMVKVIKTSAVAASARKIYASGLFHQLTRKKPTRPAFDDNAENALREILKRDMDKFRALTGKSFDHWSV